MFPTFTLQGLPAGPFDVVASRNPSLKTIIRRDQAFPDGGTMPALDFASQGFVPEAQTITVTGGSQQQIYHGASWVVTKNGTVGLLAGLPASSGGSTPFYAAPASQLIAGDLHFVQVTTDNVRGIQLFARSPAGMSVAIGPPLNLATSSNGTISLASQGEYGSYLEILICRPQPSPPPYSAAITVTKEYFAGTPATWSMTIPDLVSVQGFPSGYPNPRSWGPCERDAYGWPYLFSPLSAHEGDVFRFAGGVQ
jgi:hypothetical protein